MLRSVVVSGTALVALAMAAAAQAQKPQFGSAAEAKALLEKTVAALKADKPGTIAAINKGDGQFVDRDLYPACAALDGKVVAHPDASRIGLNRNDMKDASGTAYGPMLQKSAEEGKISELPYMYARPGTDKTPIPKVSYVTKVVDLVCLVGYYK
jgi:Single Cache domain 2